MSQLVLSLFPGIGLLDRAFEEEGFTVVRGPDLLWGGDVKRFHVPAGRFDGVIGGPPCKAHSYMANVNKALGRKPAIDLIPEYERVVGEAAPRWFLMENVPRAPLPEVAGYVVRDRLLQNRWLGQEARRLRRFSFGTRAGTELHIQLAALENYNETIAVLASDWKHKKGISYTARGGRRAGRDAAECARLQGLPESFLSHAPFTMQGKVMVIGNGVPLPMGLALARAVREALSK